MHCYSYTMYMCTRCGTFNASVLLKLVRVHFTAVECARLKNLLYI